MKANGKLWFRIAGVCCAVGVMLMLSALFLTKFDIYRLSSPVPFGVSIVRESSVDLPAPPEPPAAPAAPAAPSAPASAAVSAPAAPAPSATSAFASSASFDFADKTSLIWRALTAVADMVW